MRNGVKKFHFSHIKGSETMTDAEKFEAIKEAQREKDNSFKRYAGEYVHQCELLQEMGLSRGEAIEMLKVLKLDDLCLEFDRTADFNIALLMESIEESLAKLAALSDCISVSRGGNQFCIAGQVVNYEP